MNLKNKANAQISIELRTIAVFLIAALLPLLVISMLNILESRSLQNKNTNVLLDYVKNEKIKQVQDIYKGLEADIRLIGWNKGFNPLEGNAFIKNMILVDKDFHVIQAQKSDTESAMLELQKVVFGDDFYIGVFKSETNYASQFLFYKLPEQSELGYVAIELDAEILRPVFETIHGKLNYNLLNSNFYIIGSSDDALVYKTWINNVSKDMLDGNQGISDIEGTRYSYGFVDLGESYIYLSINEELNLLKEGTSRQLIKLFFTVAITIILVLAAAMRYLSILKRHVMSIPVNCDYTLGGQITKGIKMNIEDSLEILDEILEDSKHVDLNKKKLEDLLMEIQKREKEVGLEAWPDKNQKRGVD